VHTNDPNRGQFDVTDAVDTYVRYNIVDTGPDTPKVLEFHRLPPLQGNMHLNGNQ
jgi:hypothetical protein